MEIEGTAYVCDDSRLADLEKPAPRVQEMRAQGHLSPDVLYRIRIQNIYHSNASEGNLAVGETRQVVEHQ